MNDEPLVTIITVTYNLIKANRCDAFRKCIESVNNQTYKNIEHIIIDGASNDGTIELLEYYQRKGWIKYYSEPDKGIYDAMNKGIMRANGKYINFLNTDDYFCSYDAILMSIKKLEETQSDIIASNHNVVDLNDNFVKKNIKIGWNKMFIGEFPCHQSVFYRLQLLKKIGGYNLNVVDADNISFLTFKQYGAIFAYNDLAIVNFRIGGISCSLDRVRARNEFTNIFYDNIIKNRNFSKSDIKKMYGRAFLNLSLYDIIKLGEKIVGLGEPMWIQEYYSIVLNNLTSISSTFDKKDVDCNNKTFYFLGIPFFNIEFK